MSHYQNRQITHLFIYMVVFHHDLESPHSNTSYQFIIVIVTYSISTRDYKLNDFVTYTDLNLLS